MAEMKLILSAQPGGSNLNAFLDMIAFAEGTDNGRQITRDRGYDVLVGGALFKGYDDHPRVKVKLERLGIYSTAAGRYQVLSRYYDVYKVQLRLKDFSPLSQDMIALQLIKECQASGDIRDGRFREAVAKCKSRWASLPGAGYGQHEQQISALQLAYMRSGGFVA